MYSSSRVILRNIVVDLLSYGCVIVHMCSIMHNMAVVVCPEHLERRKFVLLWSLDPRKSHILLLLKQRSCFQPKTPRFSGALTFLLHIPELLLPCSILGKKHFTAFNCYSRALLCSVSTKKAKRLSEEES